jgi:hypothetical protein
MESKPITKSEIKRLGRMYHLTEEQVKKKLAPSYDLNLLGNHKQGIAHTDIGDIEVDEDLVRIIELIHKNSNKHLTYMSCQHNWFGWAGISFTMSGFQEWIEIVFDRTFEKYKLDAKDENYNIYTELFYYKYLNQISNDEKRPEGYIEAYVANFSGHDFATATVNWNFDRKELPLIQQKLEELWS